MSLIHKLVLAATASWVAALPALAQQTTPGGYFIHNGVVLPVPSSAPSYQPGYASTNGLAPTAGVAQPNYGPPIPVAPQSSPALNPQASAAPTNGSGYGQQFSAQNGAAPFSNPQFATPNGQSTTIYYGSSQFRRDPSPQRQQLDLTTARDRNSRSRPAQRDDRQPRLSTDQPSGTAPQKAGNGVHIDPTTGAIQRNDRLIGNRTDAGPQSATRAQQLGDKTQRNQPSTSSLSTREAELRRGSTHQQRQAELVSTPAIVNPADPRTLRPFTNLGGPSPSRLQDLPIGDAQRRMSYHMQSPVDPTADSPSRRKMNYPVSNDISASTHRSQTFLGPDPRGFRPSPVGGVNMNSNATKHFAVGSRLGR